MYLSINLKLKNENLLDIENIIKSKYVIEMHKDLASYEFKRYLFKKQESKAQNTSGVDTFLKMSIHKEYIELNVVEDLGNKDTVLCIIREVLRVSNVIDFKELSFFIDDNEVIEWNSLPDVKKLFKSTRDLMLSDRIIYSSVLSEIASNRNKIKYYLNDRYLPSVRHLLKDKSDIVEMRSDWVHEKNQLDYKIITENGFNVEISFKEEEISNLKFGINNNEFNNGLLYFFIGDSCPNAFDSLLKEFVKFIEDVKYLGGKN